ncbi:hypothetical protein NPJ82_08190 [Sphingomonas sp. NY01]|uniref:sensor histidine kinase n=1 Tax=Sphingomonas sp. NY01 TaxID=2968057 RepID=UPI00315DB7B8
MRFDDSLKTVLSAETATGFGAQSSWRQLVDLIGRGRVPADDAAIERLRALRPHVPDAVRAASARALALTTPPIALVAFFAQDLPAITGPVLRTVTLDDGDWLALLPRLTPAGRSVLRHRRDLSQAVRRGLESFGPTDFVLPYQPVEAPVAAAATAPAPAAVSAPFPDPATPRSDSSFVALGDVARDLPLIARARLHADTQAPLGADPLPEPAGPPQRFEIADLVARIDAFNRQREAEPRVSPPPLSEEPEQDRFRFETDAQGVIRWVDGVARAALVGASFALASAQGHVQFDGVATGAFRRRSAFRDARLQVGGRSDAAGSWRVSGVPSFDPLTGRFLGLQGTARRPRPDECTAPTSPATASDSLRQLVHELRTPTNAVAGFAELIESELLGPVSAVYRARAAEIRQLAGDLLAAVEDLDTAARIEGHALDLRPSVVPVYPLLNRIMADLAPLAGLRHCEVVLDGADARLAVAADDRAVERLVARLMAALVSACVIGERIGIVAADAGDGAVAITIDRPIALPVDGDASLLSLDAAPEESEGEGGPLLGTGFALRLAQKLAAEMGGGLMIGTHRLTLRLPVAAAGRPMEQASTL